MTARVTSLPAGPPAAHAPGARSTSPRPASGDFPRPAARHPIEPALKFSVHSSELEYVESGVFEAPTPRRHPLESFTPAGLVLLALLSMTTGLVLAVLLKLLSMALSVG